MPLSGIGVYKVVVVLELGREIHPSLQYPVDILANKSTRHDSYCVLQTWWKGRAEKTG
jgi:hypothetical protein